MVQKTMYSQIEEMKDRLEGGEKKTLYSEDAQEPKKYKKRRTGPNNGEFYEKYDNEEDWLLTHLSETIMRSKKALLQQASQLEEGSESQDVTEKEKVIIQTMIVEEKVPTQKTKVATQVSQMEIEFSKQ